MQMHNNMYSQRMEWLMRQQQLPQMQDSRNAFPSRVYHLEPLNANPQFSNVNGVMMSQHAGGGVMGGMSAYGPGPVRGNTQDGYSSFLEAGVGNGAALSSKGIHRTGSMGYGNAGVGGPNGAPNGIGASLSAGTAWHSADRSNVNFQEVFNAAANPLTQYSVALQDDGEPLLFPPGKILAQYPTEYQQQLVFYYRLLRLQYPQLYQQYVDYYYKYYEPLYYPPNPPAPVKEEVPVKPSRRPPPPKPKEPRAETLPPPPVISPPVYTLPPPSQPPPELPPPTESLPRTASTLSGGLKRQSSLRRQNSIRRNEVNQLKNEGGLRRLPSMRKE